MMNKLFIYFSSSKIEIKYRILALKIYRIWAKLVLSKDTVQFDLKHESLNFNFNLFILLDSIEFQCCKVLWEVKNQCDCKDYWLKQQKLTKHFQVVTWNCMILTWEENVVNIGDDSKRLMPPYMNSHSEDNTSQSEIWQFISERASVCVRWLHIQ